MEVFNQRFDSIGGIYAGADTPGDAIVGSIINPPFYIDGRADYPLDRGPWPSAKAYLHACAQRELDCSRFMFNQDTSAGYQTKVEEAKFAVERSMSLFQRLVDNCEGLDELDPDFAPFSLDIHELALRDLTVDNDDHSTIVSHCLFPIMIITGIDSYPPPD